MLGVLIFVSALIAGEWMGETEGAPVPQSKDGNRTEAINHIMRFANSISPECVQVYIQYLGTGITIKHCLVHTNSNGNKIAYWIVWDPCYNWFDAQRICREGGQGFPGPGGKIASFPTEEDRTILPLLVNQYQVGQRSEECSTDSYYINGVWIGLRRSSSSSKTWTWETGEAQADGSLQWNTRVAYRWGGAEQLSDGRQCAYFGWSIYGVYYGSSYAFGEAAGFLRNYCYSTAKVLCMVQIP